MSKQGDALLIHLIMEGAFPGYGELDDDQKRILAGKIMVQDYDSIGQYISQPGLQLSLQDHGLLKETLLKDEIKEDQIEEREFIKAEKLKEKESLEPKDLSSLRQEILAMAGELISIMLQKSGITDETQAEKIKTSICKEIGESLEKMDSDSLTHLQDSLTKLVKNQENAENKDLEFREELTRMFGNCVRLGMDEALNNKVKTEGRGQDAFSAIRENVKNTNVGASREVNKPGESINEGKEAKPAQEGVEIPPEDLRELKEIKEKLQKQEITQQNHEENAAFQSRAGGKNTDGHNKGM